MKEHAYSKQIIGFIYNNNYLFLLKINNIFIYLFMN
jgi:hypothetical protein